MPTDPGSPPPKTSNGSFATREDALADVLREARELGQPIQVVDGDAGGYMERILAIQEILDGR